jgi:glycosyltransferase involved in cell wall biosynthesis
MCGAMRIGIDTLFLDGRERSSLAYFVIAFVEAMVQYSDRHRLVLLTSPSTAMFFKSLPAGSVDVVNCPVSNETRLARILYQQTRLPLVASKNGIDVLCCLADVAPLWANMPLVLKINTLHHLTTPSSLGMLRSLYRRLMISASARRARLIIANSKTAAVDIERLLGIPRDRIRIIYEAVDDRFAPIVDRAALQPKLRERYGIDDQYLLFVSALYRYKRLDTLIRAFKALEATNRWSGLLVVVGPDPHRERRKLEDLCDRLAITGRVRFLGSVDNEKLRELYGGASVFVYPSAAETFGKPLVEAMRCGTPIVASNRGSIPDVTAGAALLVDPDDAEGMANEIHRLITDEELRTRLRGIGLARGQDFSMRAVAQRFTNVIEEAVK